MQLHMEISNVVIYKAYLIFASLSLLGFTGNTFRYASCAPITTSSQAMQERSPRRTDRETVPLLEDLESGSLEKRCTPKDLSHINQCLLFLAEEGLFLEKCEEDFLYEDVNGFCPKCTLENGNLDEKEIKMPLPKDLEYRELFFQESGPQSKMSKAKEKIAKAWAKAKQFVKKHKRYFPLQEADPRPYSW